MSALDDFNARARALDIPDHRWAPASSMPRATALKGQDIPPHVKLVYPAVVQICGEHGFKGLTVEPAHDGIHFDNGLGHHTRVSPGQLKDIEPDRLRAMTVNILRTLQRGSNATG